MKMSESRKLILGLPNVTNNQSMKEHFSRTSGDSSHHSHPTNEIKRDEEFDLMMEYEDEDDEGQNFGGDTSDDGGGEEDEQGLIEDEDEDLMEDEDELGGDNDKDEEEGPLTKSSKSKLERVRLSNRHSLLISGKIERSLNSGNGLDDLRHNALLRHHHLHHHAQTLFNSTNISSKNSNSRDRDSPTQDKKTEKKLSFSVDSLLSKDEKDKDSSEESNGEGTCYR